MRVHRQGGQRREALRALAPIAPRTTLSVVLLVVGLLFCTAATSAQVVRVGFYENAPKLYTDESGRITGFFPEVIGHIAAQEGWELEYVPGTWAECLYRLQVHDIDLMPDVAYSDARAMLYGFTDEPLFINWGVIYQRSGAEIEGIPDLIGRRIAVMEGSIHTVGDQGIVAMLAHFDIQCEFVELPDYAAVFAALQAGEADAGAVNRLFGLLNEEEYDVAPTTIVFNPRELRFAYPLGSEFGAQLAERIDVHVQTMKADPDSVYYQSLSTHLLREAPSEVHQAPHWLPSVLGGAGSIIVLSALVILLLRRRQRHLKTELAASEIQFETMFETAGVGIAVVDVTSQAFLRVNPRLCGMLGYGERELLNLSLDDVLHPEDDARNVPEVRDLVEGRLDRLHTEERLLRKDGSCVWGAITRSMVQGAPGGPGYGLALIQDITERKHAEEDRDRLFTRSLDMLCVAGFDGFLKQVNPAWTDTLGWTEKELLRTPWLELVHPDDLEATRVSDGRLRAGEPIVMSENRYRCRDGTYRWLSWSAFPVPGEELIFAVGRDITERRQRAAEYAEQRRELEKRTRELADSEARLQGVFDTMAEGMILIDPDGRITDANRAAERILGLTRSEIKRRNYTAPDWEVLRPNGTPMPPEEMAGPRAMKEKRPVKDVVMGVPRLNGTLSWLSVSAAPLVSEAGELEGIVGTFVDITDRKRAETALRESEERLRSVIEQSIDGIALVDSEGLVVEWNRGQAEITGISPEEAIGGAFWEVQFRTVPTDRREPRFLDVLREATESILAGEASAWAGRFLEQEIERPDGEARTIQIGSFPIELGDYRMLGSVSRDVTARKAAERELEKHRENLERLVVERTEALNAAIEAANAAMFRLNLLTGEVERDARWFEISGIEEADFDGTHETWRRLVHPDDLPAAEENIAKAVASTSDAMRHEYRIVRPDGTIRYIESRARILRDETGKGLALVGMNIDITDRRKAEETLRENEAFLRSMIENMPIDFFAIDRDLRYTMQSPTSRAVIGDMIGRRVDEADAPEDLREKWLAEHRRILQGESFQEENDVPAPDGTVHTFLTQLAPVRVGDEIIASLGTSIEITERKQAEERIRKLSQAVEESPVSVVITDVEGTIEYVNPRFSEVTGYSAEEALGQNPRLLKSGDQPEAFYKELWETILSGREWRGELCNRKKSGELFWETTSISPIRDEEGVITHFVAVKEDITDRKYADWELEQAKSDAERANQTKSDFLANMSHELRTPLNAVIGFSEVLEDGTFGELNEKQHQYVGNILSSGRHLLDLINDILDLSKVEAGKMDLELGDVDISRVLFESLVFVQEKAQKHGIKLETKLSEAVSALTIQADERKLKQVLFNLLSNATKFTPDGGAVDVEAELSGDELRIRVRDTGIGIRFEDLHRVFEEFEQLDSSYAKTQQGTGLGLALTKQLIELHGGRIWVESEGEGKGSTFTFTLPLVHAEGEEGS